MQVSVAFASLVLVSLGNSDSPGQDDAGFAMDNSWTQLLEMLRQVIKEGYPAAGIPVMDPYHVDFMKLELPGEIFEMSANISRCSFAGLGDFQINKFVFSQDDLTLDFDIYFPSLSFSAEYYEMEGSVMESFPLAGEGVLHIELYDFDIRSKIYLKQSADGESVLLEKFENPGFSVSRVISKIEYDNNFDDIINAMTEDLLAGYLNRFNKYLATKLCDHYINKLNSIISHLG